MKPRFIGRLGPANVVTAEDAVLGFIAAVLTTIDVHLAVEAALLATTADGLDGVVARRYGGTDARPHPDSLADITPFDVTPALPIIAIVRETRGSDRVRVIADTGVTTLSVTTAIIRLTLCAAYDNGSDETVKVPMTLAVTTLPTGVLVGFVELILLVGLSAAIATLVLSDVAYPDLHAQDAFITGVVQDFAIIYSGTLDEGFSFSLLFLALGYLFLRSHFYWA